MYLLLWSSYLDYFAVLLGEVKRPTPKYFIKRKWKTATEAQTLHSEAKQTLTALLPYILSIALISAIYSLVTTRYQIIYHESFIAAACISTMFLAIPSINIGLQSLLSLIQNLTQSELNLGLSCRLTTQHCAKWAVSQSPFTSSSLLPRL